MGRAVPIRAEGTRRAVLPTHLHNDHFDPAAVREALGERGVVLCSDDMAPAIASRGFRVRALPLYRPERWDEIVVIPVPAVDGLGDAQVSWVVISGARRLFHAGDTLWHGGFDLVGRAYGPFDVAFLPINGAIVDAPPRGGQPISLDPEQAATAAVKLDARRVVPIHYGISTDTYREHPQAVDRFRTAAHARGLPVTVLAEGEWLDAP